MADIAQVLATGGTTIVAGQVLATGGTTIVAGAVGAGLTYLFATLNRRHQEAREDQTRWYEARREAYGALLITASRVARNLLDTPGKPELSLGEMLDEVIATLGAVRLVGSPSARAAAENLVVAVLADAHAYGKNVRKLAETSEDEESWKEQLKGLPGAVHTPAAIRVFEETARRDLGHPSAGTLDGGKVHSA
jgi:hypothetical protein